ncbi:MAG: ABC transporter ATP-binding protein [Betaproteobacteria bacterium]
MDRSDTLLAVKDLHTYYGDSYVLQGLSLEVHRGQVVAILGRNGMGKTTLIRSIFGLTPARQGEVRYRGQSIEKLPPYRIAQLGVSLVPQGRRIFKNLSVKENLTLPTSVLAGAGKSPRQDYVAASTWTLDAVLSEFPNLKERLANGGSELSGGEQQMLAIGRALVSNPDLVLMDEPSEGLSPLFVKHVGEIMSRVKSLGHAILLVEQNLALALSVADYVYIISSGRFVFSGTPAELNQKPDILNEHLGVSGTKTLPH